MIDHLSTFKRLQITLLSRLYALAYQTSVRRFLGMRLASWLRWLPLVGIVVGWIAHWSGTVMWLLLLLALAIRLLYWFAQQRGYSQFVADPKSAPPGDEAAALRPYERIGLRATGVFALSNREEKVLLRPAEYWQVPLGNRIIMVEARPKQFFYQFLGQALLEHVEGGWLLFGRSPLPTLSVTFCSEWGPAHNDLTQLYYVRDGVDSQPCQRRTIYFTFENEAVQRRVWRNLLEPDEDEA